MNKVCLKAHLESVEPLRMFVTQCAIESCVHTQALQKIELVLEELVTNVINHAYEHQHGNVEVSCFVQQHCSGNAPCFCLCIRDWGTPFNPLLTPEPNLSSDVLERPIGGLGLHFVRQMALHCEYARKHDSNEITACFDMNI